MSKRITITDLRNTVEQYNRYLASCGSMKRLREQGRNGYQAVDIYTLDPDSKDREFKNGCNNLACGTARECCDHVYDFYNDEFRRIEKAKNAKLVEFAKSVVSILTAKGAKVSDIRAAAVRTDVLAVRLRTVAEIKAAVDAGYTVHADNDGYRVVESDGDYCIVFASNEYTVGLTGRDGKTLNGEKFYRYQW